MTSLQPEALRGGELVVEFIDEVTRNQGEEVGRSLSELVRQTYGCAPTELRITDAQADEIVATLYEKAVENDMRAARLPFNSK